MKRNLLILASLTVMTGLWMMGTRAPVGAASLTTTEHALAPAHGPVVVELFTSQSCSSCPPADALLGELAKNNHNIIAFSCHVTYWDHLNWRDTLSRKFCTERQRAYAAHMGSRQVYTPQMVVNGTHGFVGSNRTDAQRYISSGAVLPIKLALNKNDTISATLPALPQGASPQTLWLIRYHDAHTQAIKSGENRGKTITYTNSIEAMNAVGVWDGRAQTFQFPAPEGKAPNPGYAVIAQPNGFGAISAAGRL